MGTHNRSFNLISKNDKKPLPLISSAEKSEGLVTIVFVLPRTTMKIGNCLEGVNGVFDFFLLDICPRKRRVRVRFRGYRTQAPADVRRREQRLTNPLNPPRHLGGYGRKCNLLIATSLQKAQP